MTVLGKRKIRSGGMSAELAYNMELYFEGYEPQKMLENSKRKLNFERERLTNQTQPVNLYCHYLDQSSEEVTT